MPASGLVWFVCLFAFQDRVSLCSPSYPGVHTVDEAALEPRDLLASASQALGLKVCLTTAWLCCILEYMVSLLAQAVGEG